LADKVILGSEERGKKERPGVDHGQNEAISGGQTTLRKRGGEKADSMMDVFPRVGKNTTQFGGLRP